MGSAAPRRFRQGPKRTRTERHKARREAIARREHAHLARVLERAQARGWSGEYVRLIPLAVWVRCAQVIADASGRAARIHLRHLNNRCAAGAILEACQAESKGWASLRVRRIAALGLALVWLSAGTLRNDGSRWTKLVRGLPREAFAALLRDPFNNTRTAVPHVTTLYGTHRFLAQWHSSDVGYFVRLRAAGLVYRQQLPADQVEPNEVGTSGHTLNRYWVVTDLPTVIQDADVRAWAWALIESAKRDGERIAAQLAHERAPPRPPD